MFYFARLIKSFATISVTGNTCTAWPCTASSHPVEGINETPCGLWPQRHPLGLWPHVLPLGLWPQKASKTHVYRGTAFTAQRRLQRNGVYRATTFLLLPLLSLLPLFLLLTLLLLLPLLRSR